MAEAAERNMYGCTPCPKCGSVYRYPSRGKDGPGAIVCDDCGRSAPWSGEFGADGYSVDEIATKPCGGQCGAELPADGPAMCPGCQEGAAILNRNAARLQEERNEIRRKQARLHVARIEAERGTDDR